MKSHIINCFLFFLLIVISGCSEGSDGNVSPTGKLRVQLTDAPFPYNMVKEANVTIFKIEARKVSDEGESTEDGENTENVNVDSPYVVLMESEVQTNLLDLTNGTTKMLADIEVEAGHYNQVRVYVKDASILLTDGRLFDLKVPSGEQTGIKIFIKPALEVVGGLSSDLLLDFDVSRSFVAKGNSGHVEGITGFNFKPVIKASNLSTAGTLYGHVGNADMDTPLDLEGSQVSIISADTLYTSGFADIDGNYAIMGLEAGTYKAMAEKEGYQPSDTLEVEIHAGNKTLQDFALQVETAEEPGTGN